MSELGENEGFININMDNVDDSLDPLPDGPHKVRIKSAQKKHKSGSEFPYIDVRLNPLDIPGKEKRTMFLVLSFHPDALWNMKRFCKAAKIPIDSKGFNLAEFPGKELFITLKTVPGRDNPDERRNEVTTPYNPA